MYKYNIGDIVIRTGPTLLGELAEIVELPTGVYPDDDTYRVRFLSGRTCLWRWHPRWFELANMLDFKDPDWRL